jgi:hypothetical protein
VNSEKISKMGIKTFKILKKKRHNEFINSSISVSNHQLRVSKCIRINTRVNIFSVIVTVLVSYIKSPQIDLQP